MQKKRSDVIWPTPILDMDRQPERGEGKKNRKEKGKCDKTGGREK